MDDSDDDDESTHVTPTPPPLTPRPTLKRRITRPSFVTELVAGTPVGEYEIQEQIGEGAMGTVYSAIHPLIGKHVAVKVLKPELCANQASLDRFVHEAQAVNQIGHPNIVDVFSFNELEDGRAYFVMEWLRGEDLKVRLARGPMSVADTCEILDGIARALDAAHAKGIIHRDLKPDNVFLHQVEDGPVMVKLLDFGIAKLLRQAPGTEKTQTGNMLGTPRYISPEQARGIHIDHRSDIYSLGVMAYEMLAGRVPFQGETAMDIVVKQLSEEPPPLSQFAKVPKALEHCVMRMLSKAPAKRPSLDDVRGILNDPARRLTPLPVRGGAAYGEAPRVRRWLLVVAGLVCLLGAAVVAWRLVGEPSEAADRPAPRPAAASTAAPGTAPAAPHRAAPAGSAAPAAATRGTLEVTVRGAPSASIFVDGQQWGRGAYLKLELDPGGHDVEVKAPGRAAISQHVDLTAGQVATVAIVVPRPRIVHVRVHSHAHSHAHASHHATKRKTKHHSDDDLLAPKGLSK